MKKVAGIVIVVLLIGSAAFAGYWYWFLRKNEPRKVLQVSGNIETTEVEMSFKIPGRVVARYVDEGQMIEAGNPVAQLEDADLRQEAALRNAELQAARAQLDEFREGSRKQDIAAAEAAMQRAKATLEDLEAGPRKQEIAAAQAAVNASAAERDRAISDFDRAKLLMPDKAISKESYDLAKSLLQIAEARLLDNRKKLELLEAGYRENQIAAARAAWEQAQWQYDVIEEGPRRQEIERAQARVRQAEAALKLAETRVGYAAIVSPMTGMALSKNIEPGEYVAPGTPVVTIGDLVNVWVRAYIPEELSGRVKYGQKVLVTTDSGGEYVGRVSFISHEAEFTPKNVQTQKERVKLVYRIKIDIRNPKMDLNPGMPVDGVIEMDPEPASRAVLGPGK
ncbi:MAG: HlyD family efflux transporter periplasmic adaptor subunit [Pirellulales bacterium]|nr:HlyD family efflux transporter periplasmic adaptor subunit [Pirellulales bacterium]